MHFVNKYFDEVSSIADKIDYSKIEELVEALKKKRKAGGRVFVLGIGGSAANASHMVNDLRKLCNFEAYSPTDNVSELTARANDEGFDTIFKEYLRGSYYNSTDCIIVLSVGGGNKEKNVSIGLVNAIEYAKKFNSNGRSVFGIVGKDDGHLAKHADIAIIVPEVSPERVTPHSEEFQAVIWHCIVSHPDLKMNQTKW